MLKATSGSYANPLAPRAAVFADDRRYNVSSDDSREPYGPSPTDEPVDRKNDTYKDQKPNLISACEVNNREMKDESTQCCATKLTPRSDVSHNVYRHRILRWKQRSFVIQMNILP